MAENTLLDKVLSLQDKFNNLQAQLSDPEVIGNEHDYIHELHHSGNQEYQDAYKVHYSKYFGALNDLPFTKDGSPKDSPEQLSFT